jgi:hypothetical protein
VSVQIHIKGGPLSAEELAGIAAMSLPSQPRHGPDLFAIEGDRRRFADRTPGRADLKLVGKDQTNG